MPNRITKTAEFSSTSVKSGEQVSVTLHYKAKADGKIDVTSSKCITVTPKEISVKAAGSEVTKKLKIKLNDGVTAGQSRVIKFDFDGSIRHGNLIVNE